MRCEQSILVAAEEKKNVPEKFRREVEETIQYQLGVTGGAIAFFLSTYSMNILDRVFLNGEKGYTELQPATGYGPIAGSTNKGEIDQPIVTHQTLQMDKMAAIIFDGEQPIVPVDGEEAVKDLKVIDGIYAAIKTANKIELKLQHTALTMLLSFQ